MRSAGHPSRSCNLSRMVRDGHMHEQSTSQAKFQFVMDWKGEQRTTDLPINADDLTRLALQAAVLNMGIAELMVEALVKAIKQNKIDDMLDRAPVPHVRPNGAGVRSD